MPRNTVEVLDPERSQGAEEEEEVKKSVLSLKGVGPSTYEKLSSAGYDDLEVIAGANPRILANKCELTESFSRGIIKEARELVKMDEFHTALELYHYEQKRPRFKTNISAFDAIFSDGISYGNLIEFYGKNATGKTQLVMHFAIQESIRGGYSYIIDTHNSFSTERLRQICASLDQPFEEILERIYIRKAFNTSQQMLSLEKLRYHPLRKKIKLIVIDTATRFFRSEYTGRGYLAERQQMLNMHLSELSVFCVANQSLGIVTNHVIDSPGVFFGDPSLPAGGNAVAQNTNYRIYLRKSKGGSIKGKIISGADVPESEFFFKVVNSGIESIE